MMYLDALRIFSVSLIVVEKHTGAFFVNIEFKEKLRERSVLVESSKLMR